MEAIQSKGQLSLCPDWGIHYDKSRGGHKVGAQKKVRVKGGPGGD